MVYGEIGITPVSVDIKNRIVSYWTKLINNINETNNNNIQQKISSRTYIILHDLASKNKIKSLWIDNIKNILCNSGYSGIWYSQSFIYSKWLVKSSHQKFKDMFIQDWLSDIQRSSNTNIYKLSKIKFQQSIYIKKLPTYYCKTLISFLTRNHKLPIETGRWASTPINERKCPQCNDIGDEFHYLIKFPQFQELLSSQNIPKLKIRSYFVREIIKALNTN